MALGGGRGRVREVFDAGADASGEGRRDGEGKNGSSEGRRIGPLNVPLSRLYRDVYGAPDSSLEGGVKEQGDSYPACGILFFRLSPHA